MKINFRSAVLGAGFAGALVSSAGAALAADEFKDSAYLTMFGVDTAFILPKGSVSIGGTFSDPRLGIPSKGNDGDLAVGAGFGNPVKGVGVETDLNLTGTEPLGDSGAFTAKVARALYMGSNNVIFGAATVSNVAAWGDAKKGDTRWNVVFSGETQVSAPKIMHPVMWTLGYGSDADYKSSTAIDTEEGVFGGLGVGLTKYVGVSVSGTRNQFNAGLGFRVPGVDGLNVSVGAYDIDNNMGHRQKIVSVTYNFANLFGRG